MNRHLLLTLSLALLSNSLYAQIDTDDCDSQYEDCEEQEEPPRPHPDIYPFKPLATSDIETRVSRLTEAHSFLWNIREMSKRNLNRAETKNQPWGGSYWPLFQGQVANTYQDKDYDTFIFGFRKNLYWKRNYNLFLKRAEKIYPKIYSLDEKELAELAPSEKYDILLGDTNFDLTRRIWDFAAKWGEHKKWSFLSSIDLPAGYKISDGNSLMGTWEGICHGWAVAAGIVPRPMKTVWVTLPNGKRMPFYPNDLKALVSLSWANSTIQDAVLVEGMRCNRKRPDQDEYGRYIDLAPDKGDEEILPRCADVHPAVYHTTIINIIGLEGRSIVVDKNATAKVSNQPVSGYEFVYFNPKTGKEGTLDESMLSVEKYESDPFKSARNPETKFIVGIDMKLKYVNWERPKANETNFPDDDEIKEFEFNYDLEIDSQFRIVGGQWRVKRNGNTRLFGGKVHQPDFFWVVPKNWRDYFKPVTGLPEWNFQKASLPPVEYAPAAKSAHAFLYQVTKEFGFKEKCAVSPIKKGPVLNVDCEFKYPRPQPLINVIDKLIEMSRKL